MTNSFAMESFWYGLIIILMSKGYLALRELRIYVPLAVIRDQNTTLRCLYDLEGDQLYSVKWYFHSSEFYRFTPKEDPPIKQFRRADIIVNETASDATTLVLDKVSKSASGPYTCEVTRDQPSFFTSLKSSNLTVVDLPRNGPYISGLKKKYRLLETLRTSCICDESNPPVNLTWYLNSEPVDRMHIHKYIRKSPNTSLFTVSSTLQLIITRELYSKHRLKVRCVASLFDVYYKSTENTIELDRKRHRNSHYYHKTIAVTTSATTTELSYIQWELTQAAESQADTTLTFFPANGKSRVFLHLPWLTTILSILTLSR